MKNLREFTLVTKDNQTAYLPGDVIHGELYVSFDEPITMKSMRVCLFGEGAGAWLHQEDASYANASKDSDGKLKKQILVDVGLLVFGYAGDKDENTETHENGRYVYAFEFNVPKNLPCTFKSPIEKDLGFAKYSLQAVISRPKKYDKVTKLAIVINKLINPEHIPSNITPGAMKDASVVNSACMPVGTLSFESYLPQLCYTQGDNIQINANAENNSPKVMKEIYAKLIRRVRCKSKFGSSTYTMDETKVHGPRIPSEQKLIWDNQKMRIPSIGSTVTGNNDDIRVDYIVRVGMHEDKGSEIHLDLPVIIGTIGNKEDEDKEEEIEDNLFDRNQHNYGLQVIKAAERDKHRETLKDKLDKSGALPQINSESKMTDDNIKSSRSGNKGEDTADGDEAYRSFDDNNRSRVKIFDDDINIALSDVELDVTIGDETFNSARDENDGRSKSAAGRPMKKPKNQIGKERSASADSRLKTPKDGSAERGRAGSALSSKGSRQKSASPLGSRGSMGSINGRNGSKGKLNESNGSLRKSKPDLKGSSQSLKSNGSKGANKGKSGKDELENSAKSPHGSKSSLIGELIAGMDNNKDGVPSHENKWEIPGYVPNAINGEDKNAGFRDADQWNNTPNSRNELENSPNLLHGASAQIEPITEDVQAFAEEGDLHAGLDHDAYLNKLDENSPKLLYGDYPTQNKSNNSAGAPREPIAEDVQSFAEEGDLHAGLDHDAYLNKLDENSPKLLYGNYPIQNKSNNSAGAPREPIAEDVQSFAEEGDLHAGIEDEAYLDRLDDLRNQGDKDNMLGVESPIIPSRKNDDHATVDDEEYLREFERLEQEFQAKSPSAQKRMQENRPIPVEHTEEQGTDQLLNGGYELDGEYQSYSQHPMSPITEEKEEAVEGTGLDGTPKSSGGELKTSTPASNALSNDHNNLDNLKDNASADPGSNEQHLQQGNDNLRRKDDGNTDGEKKVGDHPKDEKKTGLSSPWGIVGMIGRLLGRKKKEEDKEDSQTPLKKTDADSATTAGTSENPKEDTQQPDNVDDKERSKLPEKMEDKKETSKIQGMLDALDGGEHFDKQGEHGTPSKDSLNASDGSRKVGEGEDVRKSKKAAEQDKSEDVQQEKQKEGDLKEGGRTPFNNDQTNGIVNSETNSTQSEDQSECGTNTDMADIQDEAPEEDSLEDIQQQNNIPLTNSESKKDPTNTIMKNKTKSTKPKTGPNKKEKLEASKKLGKQEKDKSENKKKIVPLKPEKLKKPKAVAKKPASEASKKGKGIRIPTSIPETKSDSSFSSDSFFSSHSSSESDDEREKRTSKLKQPAGELYGDSTKGTKAEREKGKQDSDKVAGPREARNEKKQCNDMFPEDEGYGTIGRQKDKNSQRKGQGKDNEISNKPNPPSSKRSPVNKISNIKPQEKPVSQKDTKSKVSKNPAKVQVLSPSQSPAKEKIKKKDPAEKQTKSTQPEDKRLKKQTTISPKASKVSSAALPSQGSKDNNGVRKLKKSPDTASQKLKKEKPMKQSDHNKKEKPTQNKVNQKRHPSSHTSLTDELPYVASPNHISDQYYPDHHDTNNNYQGPGDSLHHPTRSSSPTKSKQDPTAQQQHGSASEKVHQHDPYYNDPAKTQQRPEDISRGGNRSSSPTKSKQDPTSRQQHGSAPEKIHQHDPNYNDPARAGQKPEDMSRGGNRSPPPTKSKQDPTSRQQHSSAPEKIHQHDPYYNDPARAGQKPEDMSRGGNRSSSPTKSKQDPTSRQQHGSAPEKIHQHDPYYNDPAREGQKPEDISQGSNRSSSPVKSKQDPTSNQQHGSASEKVHQHDPYYNDPAKTQQRPEDISRGGNRSSSPTKSKQDPTSRQQHGSAPEKIHQHDPYYNDPARAQQRLEDISRGGNRSSSPTKSKQDPTSRQQHSFAPEKLHQHDPYYNDPARAGQKPEDISRGGNRSSSPTKSKQDPTSRQQHGFAPEKIHQHDPYYNDPARTGQKPEDISQGSNRSSSPAKSKQDPTSRQQHGSASEKLHQHDPYYNDPAKTQQRPEEISRGGNRSSSPTKSKQDPTSLQQHGSAPEKMHQHDPYYNDPARTQQRPEDISRGGNRSSSPTKSKQDPTSRQQHGSAPEKIHQHDPYYNDPARTGQKPEDISQGSNRSSSPAKSKQDPTSRQQHGSASEKLHQHDPYYNDPAKTQQRPEDISRGGNRSSSPIKSKQDATSLQQHGSAPEKMHQHDPYYNDPAKTQQRPEDISRGGNRSSSPTKSKQDPTSRQQHGSAPEKLHQHDPYYNDPAKTQQRPEDISRGGNRSSSPTKSKQDPTSLQQHGSAPEKIHQHDPYYNDPAKTQQRPEDISRGGNRSSSPTKSKQDPTSRQQHGSAQEKIHQHDPYYNDPARAQQKPEDISRGGNRSSSPTKSKQDPTSRQQHGFAPEKIHQHDPYYNDPARAQQRPEDISRGDNRSSSPTKSKQDPTSRQQHGSAPEKLHQHDPYYNDPAKTQQRPEDISRGGNRSSLPTKSKQDPTSRQQHGSAPEKLHQHDPYYNDPARTQQRPEDISRGGNRSSSPTKSKQDLTSLQQHGSAPEKIHQHDPYYNDPAKTQQRPEDISRGGNRSSSPTKSKQDPTSRQQHGSAPEKLHQHDPYYNDPARTQQRPEDISRGGNRSSSPTKSKQDPTSLQQHGSAPEKIHQHDPYYNDPAKTQQRPEDISRGGNRSSSPTKFKQDPTSRQQHGFAPEKIHQHDPYYNDPARAQQRPEDISRGGNRSSSPSKSKQDPTSRQQISSAPEKIHQHDPYSNDPARAQQIPEDISRGGNRSSSPANSEQYPYLRQIHDEKPANRKQIHQSPNRQKKDQIWSAKDDDGFYDPYSVHERMPKHAGFIPSQVPDNVKGKSPKKIAKTKKTPQNANRTPEKMDKKVKPKKQNLALRKDDGSNEETKSNNRKTKAKEERIHNKTLLGSTANPIKEKVTYSDDEKVPLNNRYIPTIPPDKIRSGETGDNLLQTKKKYPKTQHRVNSAESTPTKKTVNTYGHNDKTKNTQSKNQSQSVTKKPYVSPYRQIPKSKKRVTPPEHTDQLSEAENDLHQRPDKLVGLEAMLEKGVKIGPELSMDKNNEESMMKGKDVSSRYGSAMLRSLSAPNAPQDGSTTHDMCESKDRYDRMKSEDAKVFRSQYKPKNDAKRFSSSWNGPRDCGYMESRGHVLPYVGYIERHDHDRSVSLEDIDQNENKHSRSFENKPAGSVYTSSISPVHSNSFDFVLVPPYATETVTLHGGNEDITLKVVLDEIKTKQPTQDKIENKHKVIKDKTNSIPEKHTADAIITEATKSGNGNKTQKKQTDLPLKKTKRDKYEDEGGNENYRIVTESLTLPPVPTESTKVPEEKLKLPPPPAKTESKKYDTKTDRNLNVNKPSSGGFASGGFSVQPIIPSREKMIVPVNYFPLTRSPPTTKKQNQSRQTNDDATSRARSASPQKRSYKTEKEKRSRSLSPIQFKAPDETSQKTDSPKQKPAKVSNNNTQKSKIPLRSPRDATQKTYNIAQTTTTSSATKIKSPRATQGKEKRQINTGGDHNLSTSLDHSTHDERVVIGGGLIFHSPKKSAKRTIVARERKSKVHATSSSKIGKKEQPPRSRSKIIHPTHTLQSGNKQPKKKKQKDEVDELIELALKEEIKRSQMDGTEPYKEPTTSCGFAGSIPRVVAYDVSCSPTKERRIDGKNSSAVPYQTERNTQQTQSITSSKQTFDFVGVTPSYENKVNLTRFEKKQKEELMSGEPMFEENYIHQAQEKQQGQQGVVIMRKPPKSAVRPLRSSFQSNSQLDTNKPEILATKIPQWYKQTTPADVGVNHLKVRSRDDSFDSFEHHEKLLGIVDEHGKLKRKRGLLESILGEDEYEELQIRKSRVQRRRYKRFLEDLETVKHGRPASCPGAIGPREGWFEISDQMYGDINSSETGTEYTSDDEHYARIQLPEPEPQQEATDDTKLHRITPYHSISSKGTHVDFPPGGFGYEEEILETYQFIEERERKR